MDRSEQAAILGGKLGPQPFLALHGFRRQSAKQVLRLTRTLELDDTGDLHITNSPGAIRPCR